MASASYWLTQPPQPRAEKEDRKMARVQQPGWNANTAVPAVWVHNPLAKVQQPGWNALGAPHALNEAHIICQMCQLRGCVSVGSNRVKSGISGGQIFAALFLLPFTLGLSLLLLLFPGHEYRNQATCSNCGCRWYF